MAWIKFGDYPRAHGELYVRFSISKRTKEIPTDRLSRLQWTHKNDRK